MEKLYKCKQHIKEFGVSVLTGTAVLFLLFSTRCFCSVSGSASGVYSI